MFNLILWIVIGAAALTVDIVTSAFLFIWFTIGAIGAIIAQILNYSFLVQFIVFVVVSTVLMIICYPIVKKNIKKSVKPTPLREKTYIGKDIVVDEEMVKNNGVKVDGVYWNIKNREYVLKKGDRIKIVGMEGNKLIIKKL
ncbi:NfeD family protein [Clostridium sp. MT-14]|jgi:membrane protein implicated in regulation of membrane protease activity|uniref:NfeD family protein n=1 Tax=Clostridium aromativorans TaxID=2836848 RepID=A0ABS8N4T9_9CLOT|nr:MULTISPECIES: NfeD family protein [Clostridium]KAA8676553.1 NfeD family protein [Clostridium sp. HV4-5-A1G]MCC9294095.1 NfeD family protein [Clostridium aromativorans]CAB1239642.1 Putative activity regulator of membrane protease YbbK [Clostridiaceae bacterium BL-3]